KTLRAFTSKHRPAIAHAAVHALNVFVDPSRAEQDLLCIRLRPRSDSSGRTQTAYIVTAVNVVGIDTFPAAQEMRVQLQLASDEQKRTGMAGAIFALLVDLESKTSNVVTVGFPKAMKGVPAPRGSSWEEWLTRRLNEGIV
ncbi:hypothetical protein DFH09DRAFT_850178, partial [Mycena vulgaris]